MEGTFESVYPRMYSVNSVSDLNVDVVNAFYNEDNAAIGELCSGDNLQYDFYICVNKGWHAFVLCVPVRNPGEAPERMEQNIAFLAAGSNPFVHEIPNSIACERFELAFEYSEQRMYKIKYLIRFFMEIEEEIQKSFYIGRYSGLNRMALQFTALRAAPKRYRVLLDDCVEFAKSFCTEALAYSKNYKVIETAVKKNIEQATASGFSVENLSRQVRSSGLAGNTLLGGIDHSQMMSGRRAPYFMIAAAAALFVIYPLVVALIVINLYGGCGKN